MTWSNWTINDSWNGCVKTYSIETLKAKPVIPFFRKIRKKMADDNRPIQYIRYAIGEIALVVIGILIALQINNWNEERKKNNDIRGFMQNGVTKAPIYLS
jgi:hypothetical protein